MGYLLLKSFHIIVMVTWFAGLFYLPRLFVYHAMSLDDERGSERFKVMERKLFWGIMTPGGILTLLTGAIMAFGYGIRGPWLWPKIVLVGLLVGYHVLCGRLVRAFRDNKNQHNHVWYRYFNEAPVLALVAIILLVVIKPTWGG